MKGLSISMNSRQSVPSMAWSQNYLGSQLVVKHCLIIAYIQRYPPDRRRSRKKETSRICSLKAERCWKEMNFIATTCMDESPSETLKLPALSHSQLSLKETAEVQAGRVATNTRSLVNYYRSSCPCLLVWRKSLCPSDGTCFVLMVDQRRFISMFSRCDEGFVCSNTYRNININFGQLWLEDQPRLCLNTFRGQNIDYDDSWCWSAHFLY